MKHVKIKISGKVQGVWFRKHSVDEAEKLNVNGWVKNEPDGTIAMEVEGETEKVDKFINWCHKGSPHSRVENVEVLEGKPQHFENFQLRY